MLFSINGLLLMTIRPMQSRDAESILRIYGEGIATRLATFETQIPTWDHWDRSHLSHSRWVAIDDQDQVLGWAALSPVSSRCAYEGVAELGIYIGEGHRGKGIGSALMQAIKDSAQSHGLWTIQSSIFRENEASYLLHITHGFREIGYRERIGQLDGKWLNTTILECRF